MQKSVVTGGSGFLGKALACALILKGHQVFVTARKPVPDLVSLGVKVINIDLAGDLARLEPYLNDADAVFHTAAKVSMWGKLEDFQRVNVEATCRLLRACENRGVERFIYTSSPSVIANGYDLVNVDESIPYPDHYEAFYPQTKALAEKAVLAASSIRGMRTLALRPHLIFGPGDTNLIPTIIEKAQRGRLIRIGEGENLTDLTYIDDCVEAHIAAYESLNTNINAHGRTYFISQGEPVKLWSWVDRVLDAFHMPPVRRSLSFGVARLLARGAEWWVRNLAPNREPFITNFLVTEMATSHYFNISAARRELGYKPRYTINEAMHKTFANALV
jgi:nucleoside-diphosphate-sugar epimerase